MSRAAHQLGDTQLVEHGHCVRPHAERAVALGQRVGAFEHLNRPAVFAQQSGQRQATDSATDYRYRRDTTIAVSPDGGYRRTVGRRDDVLEATLRVLGEQGPYGLTHRKIDQRVAVPASTVSNSSVRAQTFWRVGGVRGGR